MNNETDLLKKYEIISSLYETMDRFTISKSDDKDDEIPDISLMSIVEHF